MLKNKAKSQRKSWRLHQFFFFFITMMTILLFVYVNGLPFELIDEPFCDIETELYSAIMQHIDEWNAIFPDNFEAVGGNDRLFFETTMGQKYVVHAVYWTTENGFPIYFVPIETKLRRMLEIGLYGLFYTPYGELPNGIEVVHLENNIYCYRVE